LDETSRYGGQPLGGWAYSVSVVLRRVAPRSSVSSEKNEGWTPKGVIAGGV